MKGSKNLTIARQELFFECIINLLSIFLKDFRRVFNFEAITRIIDVLFLRILQKEAIELVMRILNSGFSLSQNVKTSQKQTRFIFQ